MIHEKQSLFYDRFVQSFFAYSFIKRLRISILRYQLSSKTQTFKVNPSLKSCNEVLIFDEYSRILHVRLQQHIFSVNLTFTTKVQCRSGKICCKESLTFTLICHFCLPSLKSRWSLKAKNWPCFICNLSETRQKNAFFKIQNINLLQFVYETKMVIRKCQKQSNLSSK